MSAKGRIPLVMLAHRHGGTAGHPTDVIFLTCDAFGVLPPIARLTPAQAMYHFISGYTAKLAGTEIGVREPKATFSACFGAPFMPLHPSEYAKLLAHKIEKHNACCWLVNTGWTGGPYGVGERISIKYTRALINAALEGRLDHLEYIQDPFFCLSIPASCPGVRLTNSRVRLVTDLPERLARRGVGGAEDLALEQGLGIEDRQQDHHREQRQPGAQPCRERGGREQTSGLVRILSGCPVGPSAAGTPGQ